MFIRNTSAQGTGRSSERYLYVVPTGRSCEIKVESSAHATDRHKQPHRNTSTTHKGSGDALAVPVKVPKVHMLLQHSALSARATYRAVRVLRGDSLHRFMSYSARVLLAQRCCNSPGCSLAVANVLSNSEPESRNFVDCYKVTVRCTAILSSSVIKQLRASFQAEVRPSEVPGWRVASKAAAPSCQGPPARRNKYNAMPRKRKETLVCLTTQCVLSVA